MTTATEMQVKFEELEKAVNNTIYLLENPGALADMHGLKYWAGVVEQLREDIKEGL